MKKSYIAFSLVFSLLVLSWSPTITQAQAQPVIQDSYRATLIQLITVLQQQILALQAELARRQAVTEASTVLVKFSDAAKVLAVYEISNPTQIKNISNREHREYFNRVFELLPTEYGSKFSKLQIFGGEGVYFDAFVETVPPTHASWQYSVHEKALKDIGSLPTAELIVHELGHLISYEALPGKKNKINKNCPTYFDRHGCPPLNSYLDEYVKQFWSSEDLKRAENYAQTKDMLASAQAHYRKNSGHYVTDYAALGPEEDFSETFMYFIMGKEGGGAVAEQKISFFKEYAKLEGIQAHVLKQL